MSEVSNHTATVFLYIVGISATVGDVLLYIVYLFFRANKVGNERQISTDTQIQLNTIVLFILVFSSSFLLLYCIAGSKIQDGFLLHSVGPGLFFLALFGVVFYFRLSKSNRGDEHDVYDL